MYLMLGIVGLVARLGQGICFSSSSEKLTRRARDQSFRSILRQDIGFFDEKQHSTGAMTAFLSTSTTHLNSLSGAIFGSILSFSSTLAGGIILSLVVGWKLALVCSATIPLVAGCGWVRLKMLAVFDDKIRKTNEESATYASEAVSAIRTVASLSLEERILDHYSNILARQAAKSLRSILQASALYAASQSCVFLCAALAFWYGGTLISSHQYTMLQFFICFAALISGSQSAGAVFSFAPDISKAIHAGRDMKALFDRRPHIDTWDPAGKRIEDEKCNGRIEIENISFRYPTRPERLVLDNFSLSIQPGQYIALVGPSGCGKSTIISLLERFFDPVDGQIRVNGEDISKLNINDYRRLVSLVGQEPTVYQGTIRENVVLGSAPGVSEEAIIQACREANIYDFIMSLP
jgi:ATP-binding cassette, subfamily B (MDR/TAP), member 1